MVMVVMMVTWGGGGGVGGRGTYNSRNQIPRKECFPQKHSAQPDTFDFDLETAALGTGEQRELLGLVHGVVCACNHDLVSGFPAADIIKQMKLHAIHDFHPET